MELPRLQPLFETYRERGFEIVAVEARRDRARAEKLIADKGLTYTVLENGEGDEEVVRRLFGVRSFPSSFLIDRDGRILYAHVGFEEGDETRLAREIESLL